MLQMLLYTVKMLLKCCYKCLTVCDSTYIASSVYYRLTFPHWKDYTLEATLHSRVCLKTAADLR